MYKIGDVVCSFGYVIVSVVKVVGYGVVYVLCEGWEVIKCMMKWIFYKNDLGEFVGKSERND